MRMLFLFILIALAACSPEADHSDLTPSNGANSHKAEARQAMDSGIKRPLTTKPDGSHLDEAYCLGKGGDPNGPFGNAKACFIAACDEGDQPSCRNAASYNGNLVEDDAPSSAAAPARLEDMDYLTARKIIIGYGWTPLGGPCEGMVEGANCAQFPEIGNCSGVGLGFCDMNFSKKGRCLIVLTTGGPPDVTENSAQVRDVTFKKGPCKKDPNL